jgi:hypothetical protein
MLGSSFHGRIRSQAHQGLHLPRQRREARRGYSLPPIRWWYWPDRPSQAVQDHEGYATLKIDLREWHLCNCGRLLGRWPEKSVRFLLNLLKNAESNADAKNLELEDLYVKSIVVQQAPVRGNLLMFVVDH